MADDRRSALITGCSSGIGLDAARTLAARGWRVFATCRKPEDCARLRDEGLESFPLDHADEASVAEAAAEALARVGGRLDAAFLNGAYAIPGYLEDVPTDAMRAIFEANLFGWHALTRALIPPMRAAGAGRLVYCSSVLGFSAAPWRGSYVATKHALEGYVDTLRLELRADPIRAILIEPGPVATRFNENARAQFARWIDRAASARGADYARLDARYGPQATENRFTLPASAVSAKLVRALESPRPRDRYFVTTPTYAVAALRRLAPRRLLDALMARQ